MKCVVGMLEIFCLIVSFAVRAEDNRPEYQKEYESYMRDLKIIAQTGKAPKNPELEADLAKMDSEEKICLTAAKAENIVVGNRAEIQPLVFAQLEDAERAEIVNRVEIIRVPEEFRQQYADVYKEENETISAQSLAERQSSMQKEMIIDDSTAKVAAHLNPFRFLKETKLSPLPGEYGTKELPLNPMVNAYFNQFGRPYAPGSKAVAEPKPQEQKENLSAGGSSVNSLSLRNSMFVD